MASLTHIYCGMLMLALPLKAAPAVAAATAVDPLYVWQPVAIGGGEVTGVYPVDREVAYARTPRGGVFRWAETKKLWTPITRSLQNEQQVWQNVVGMAVARDKPKTLYIACSGARQHGKTPAGAILKSTDQGDHWTQTTDAAWNVTVTGLEPGSRAGQRLVIDPNDSNILLYGSNCDGLWRTSDGGKHWQLVPTFPGTAQSTNREGTYYGITSLAFDANLPGRVYGASWDEGLFQSDNSGRTWRKIDDGPREVYCLGVAARGELWAAHSKGLSQWVAEVWRSYEPAGPGVAYAVVAFDRGRRVLVATHPVEGEPARLFLSEDAAATWKPYPRLIQAEGAWFTDRLQRCAINDMAFDSNVPGCVWLATDSGLVRSEFFGTARSLWKPVAPGPETNPLAALTAISDQTLLMAVTGGDGLLHSGDVSNEDLQRLDFQANVDVANFAVSTTLDDDGVPAKVVCVGRERNGRRGYIAVSTDGGQTWAPAPSPVGALPPGAVMGQVNEAPLRIAISAENDDNWVVTCADGSAWRTDDSGATWTACTGLPRLPTIPVEQKNAADQLTPANYAQWLAADQVTDAVFYIYQSGSLYRSTDGGAVFTVASAEIPTVPEGACYGLATSPVVAGDIWAALGPRGVWRSRDGGKTWKEAAAPPQSLLGAGKFDRADFITFSTSSSDVLAWIPYIAGARGGKAGIFRWTRDNSWQRIGDPDEPFNYQITGLTAGLDLPGQLYIGTAGNGVWVGRPFSAPDLNGSELPEGGRRIYHPVLAMRGRWHGRGGGGGGGKPPPPCPYHKNLIENGDAQEGRGSPDGSEVKEVPYWSTTNSFTVIGPQIGNRPKFFAGGPAPRDSKAMQRIDLTPTCFRPIDAGNVRFKLEGQLGGVLNYGDNAILMVTFWGKFKDPKTGQEVDVKLKERFIGPITPADRNSETQTIYQKFTGWVPKKTRWIQVDLKMNYANGIKYNQATADNLSLVIDKVSKGTHTDEDELPDTDQTDANKK